MEDDIFRPNFVKKYCPGKKLYVKWKKTTTQERVDNEWKKSETTLRLLMIAHERYSYCLQSYPAHISIICNGYYDILLKWS